MALGIKSKGLLSILVLGSGNVIGTIISAIALILFSRFMGPAEFGLFSAGLAAMQIVVRLADMGTNMAIERSLARTYIFNKALADRHIRVGIWIKTVVLIVCFTIGWFLAPWMSSTILHIDSYYFLRLAIILSIGTVFFEFATILFQSNHAFATVARITIAQAAGKLLFGLLLLWQGMLNATTALLLYGVMPGLGTALFWSKLPISGFTLPKTWKKDIVQLLAVAKWTGIAAVSATLADNIDTLMVQSFMSSYDTGIWAGAVRIAAFGSLLGWTVGSVLSNRVARYHDPENLKKYIGKSWKIALGSFVLLLLTVPFAKYFVLLTIGKEYLSAVYPLQILLISTGLAAAISPYSALFYLFDRPQYYAYAGIFTAVLLIVGDFYLIPLIGINGAAYVRLAVKAITLIFTVYYAYNSLDKHLKKV